jgi:glycosyltransferase involved in cell wall biosynthesis
MPKILRISTVALSLNVLLKGQLAFLNKYFNIKAVSGHDNDLDEVKNRENVEIIAVEMKRKISLFNDFKSLLQLYVIFKKEKPQIIHSITPKAGLLSMLAGKMAGVPIRMHTFTGLIFPSKTGIMQKILITMDQLLCWSATHIYPEGKGVESDLKRYKITRKPLKIIANGNVNGIDLNHYDVNHFDEYFKKSLKRQLNIKEQDFIFIFVGRLVGDKGINELVEAYDSVRNLNTKLLLVGPYENQLDPLKEITLQKIDNFDDIISVGFKKDVRPYFAISDALVFPSYREGFPNVVMQAGAMDLPSIVSNINGCNEIIIEGENGTIIPSKNVKELAKAMKMFLEDREKYKRMKVNARAKITDRYEQNIVWSALLEEYSELLEQKNYV